MPWPPARSAAAASRRCSCPRTLTPAQSQSAPSCSWYSPFLLACWDAEAEELQSLCRCMSGFSDAFYKEALERWVTWVGMGGRVWMDAVVGNKVGRARA